MSRLSTSRFASPRALALALALLSGLARAQGQQAPAATQPGGGLRWAVMPMGLAGGLDAATGKLLDELLVAELARRGAAGDSFLSSAEVAALLGLEERKQLAACADDSCLAELGNALGADRLVTASLGQLGDEYLLSGKVMDPRAIVVLRRETLATSADERALAAAVRELAGRLTDAEPSVAATVDGTPGALPLIGAGAAGLGAALLVASAGVTLWADSVLGDVGASGAFKQSAATAYWASLGGAGAGALLAAVGVVLILAGD